MTFVIRDRKNNVYVRENYVGKGAFSKSYVLKKGDETYCGKFIVKDDNYRRLDSRSETVREFKILARLKHQNIVNFVRCVETSSSFCLITDYYPNKSVFELIQRRDNLTVYEVRFFSSQLLSALTYLHDENAIIHRDVKPQNMLLDVGLNLKLSDFGMAVLSHPTTGLVYKRHIYGTPNYISPEMITKSAHSYDCKVDIWAVGCFLYHAYTGRMPFRGKTLKILYSNIRNCEYRSSHADTMPKDLSALIANIFQKDAKLRPTAEEISNDDFFRNGFTPASLPITALVEKPKFMIKDVATNGSSSAPEWKYRPTESAGGSNKFCENKCLRRYLKRYQTEMERLISRPKSNRQPDNVVRRRCRSSSHRGQQHQHQQQKQHKQHDHEIEYPMLDPFVWVARLCKRDKNVGYQLNDGTTGVLFDDKTVLTLLPDRYNLYYVNADKRIKFYTIFKHSNILENKISILKSIFDSRRRNDDDDDTAAVNAHNENKDWLPMLPYLLSFYETRKYYVLFASNGLYQVMSKLDDDTNLLLCTKTGGFSVLAKGDRLKTYDLDSLLDTRYPESLRRSLATVGSSLKRVLAKNVCFACRKEKVQ